MLNAGITFFLIGILAYVLGANQIAGLSIEVGKLLLIIFVFMAIISFLINMLKGKKR